MGPVVLDEGWFHSSCSTEQIICSAIKGSRQQQASSAEHTVMYDYGHKPLKLRTMNPGSNFA